MKEFKTTDAEMHFAVAADNNLFKALPFSFEPSMEGTLGHIFCWLFRTVENDKMCDFIHDSMES
jgi:hypothetical protein